MKKFLIPLFAVAFTAAVVNADEAAVAPVVPAAPAVVAAAPAAAAPKADAPVAAAPAADAAAKPDAPKAKVEERYFASARDLFDKYLTQNISAYPWYSVAATVVLTVAAVKAIDYATAADEEDEF